MCLGIPGQIVEIVDAEKQFGGVEVSGVTHPMYFGILEPEDVQIGTWVLTNAGMAISTLEASEASQILQLLEALNRQFEEVQS